MFKAVTEIAVSILPITGQPAGVLEYWIYNNLKILAVLALVVFLISYLRTYFPPGKIREYLKNKRAALGYLFAVSLGVISPFCSCSTIPIFLGLVSAGVPFGIIITFLFVSPMVNLAAIIVLSTVLGWQVALAYLLGGVTVAVLGSVFLSGLGMEKHIIDFGLSDDGQECESDVDLNKRERLHAAYRDGKGVIKQIFPYVLMGVTIGAFIHGFVPQDFVAEHLSSFYSVPGAVALGVPIYTDIMGVIPIAESLIEKGLPVGTAVAFMMSVAALSLPQFVLLKKAMDKKLLISYGGVLSAGIIILGFLLNFFL